MALNRLTSVATTALLLSACVGHYKSEFPVVVVNRTANTLQALANGNAMGDVPPGQSASFNLQLQESNTNTFVNGTAPTPQADVTFTAKDTKTGALSSEKSMTISQGSPTYIAFDATDFPSTGPTIARFTFSPTNPTINQDISFNGASSTVSNGSYGWDFGDGQNATGVLVTHRYVRNGTFTVTLSVTSDTKATSTQSRTINISATLPANTATFTLSPTNPAINQVVTFTASSGGVGGGFPGGPGGGGGGAPGVVGTYTWDFGDGGTAAGTPATHQYTRGGTYTVTLRVTTDAGLSATSSRTVTVSTTLPAGSANFTFSPTDPLVGDSVFFNASSSTVTGTYTWDFGDGTSGSGVAPTHSYGSAHTFTVTMTVVNAQGQSATTSKTVPVTATP